MMQAFFGPRRLLAWLVCGALATLLAAAPVLAQPVGGEGAQVNVQHVRFGQVRAPGGGETWTEAVVDLAVVPATDGGVYARWADNVRVTLSISIRKRTGEFDFFRATAEAVSLEAGRAAFRFYLPAAIARREQLSSTEPYAWMVEVSAGGKPVPAAPNHASPLLASADALRSFKDRVARQTTQHDGVLLPQFDSPFAQLYAGETPTFVRR